MSSFSGIYADATRVSEPASTGIKGAEGLAEKTARDALPMCFAMPAHHETLDGSWVSRTPTVLSSKGWETCRLSIIQKACISPQTDFSPYVQRAGGQQADRIIFEPRTCSLPAFDSADFLRLVGKNHTLWMVGDSVSGQMYDTLKCVLSANPVVQIEAVHLDPSVLPVAMKTKGFSAGDVRVFWIKVYKMTSDDLFATMTRIGSKPLDIIVLNIGVRTLRRPPDLGLDRMNETATCSIPR